MKAEKTLRCVMCGLMVAASLFHKHSCTHLGQQTLCKPEQPVHVDNHSEPQAIPTAPPRDDLPIGKFLYAQDPQRRRVTERRLLISEMSPALMATATRVGSGTLLAVDEVA